MLGLCRHELTEAQLERSEPLLPPQRPPTGRPTSYHRTVVDRIFWIFRTGDP
jgi:transposase